MTFRKYINCDYGGKIDMQSYELLEKLRKEVYANFGKDYIRNRYCFVCEILFIY
jgi:hypothetical protein